MTGLVRMTVQLNQRNKASAFYTPYWKSNPTRRDRTSEDNFIDSRAATDQTTPIVYGAGVRWTSTATNKLLLDSGFAIRYVTSARGPQPFLTESDVARVDLRNRRSRGRRSPTCVTCRRSIAGRSLSRMSLARTRSR